MYAKDIKIGKEFININTDEILTVIEEDGVKYFELECGDLFNWVDEDLYITK